jgi:hypothetical protein
MPNQPFRRSRGASSSAALALMFAGMCGRYTNSSSDGGSGDGALLVAPLRDGELDGVAVGPRISSSASKALDSHESAAVG